GIGLLPVLEVVGAKDTTRFIDGIEVVNQKTSQVLQGTVDLGPILDRIKSGGNVLHSRPLQNLHSDKKLRPVENVAIHVCGHPAFI
ncbi:hypothetical protein, partial [Achromobacter marplatensis]|uniref:hypothetical protein n=1 Tax=Achromobacter marplatensis TaxID=470868 RepID=UPI0039F6A6DD